MVTWQWQVPVVIVNSTLGELHGFSCMGAGFNLPLHDELMNIHIYKYACISGGFNINSYKGCLGLLIIDKFMNKCIIIITNNTHRRQARINVYFYSMWEKTGKLYNVKVVFNKPRYFQREYLIIFLINNICTRSWEHAGPDTAHEWEPLPSCSRGNLHLWSVKNWWQGSDNDFRAVHGLHVGGDKVARPTQ